jgi:hypothetical protein
MPHHHIDGVRCVLTRRQGLALLLAGVGTGCATTQIESTWKDPSFAGPPFKKLMVLGISRQATPRRVFEDTFVAELVAQGVQAVPGHVHLPQDGPPEREAAVKAVRAAGVDGVIVTRLVARESEVRRDWQPMLLPMRTLEPGLGHAWVKVYEPREVEIVRAIAETTVYRASDGLLVWSALTDSADPTNWQSASRGFARTAIAAMKKQTVV